MALDFLTSYGIAIIIMIIAIAVAYQVSVQSHYAFAPSCSASPGFSCGYYSIDQNGILTISLSQATGSAVVVSGIACSSSITNNGLPGSGNLYVTNSITYYPPSNSPGTGITLPSSGTQPFYLYCYGSSNAIAKSLVTGGSYIGYVWLNYTIQNTNIKDTQQIASVSLTLFN